MQGKQRQDASHRRRGTVVVAAAIMMVALLGFAALAVDVGNLYAAKGQLQRAADAAALAGASTFSDNSLRQSGNADDPDELEELAVEWATARAWQYGYRNETTGVATGLGGADIVVGEFDFANPTAPLGTGNSNAVQVTARFTEGSPNGPVDNFFASLFGFHQTDVVATATAAFDDHVAGYTPTSTGPLIPFSIHVDVYEDLLVNGPDQFSYDPDLGVVQPWPDGVSEIRLFPYEASDPPTGAGNFGLLNVGTLNQGVPAIANQIENGVSPEELAAEIGTSELTFYDDDGNALAHLITGSPGMDSGLIPAIESRLNTMVGFFVHSGVSDTSGANADYTIVKIVFGRLMEVNLPGSPDDRRIIVQPAVWTDPGVRTDPDAPSTGGLLGRLVLVR